MPKLVDHDERREMIVAATCALIADEGIDAATMRRIAERTGSTTGLVTHYFDSKDALLLDALRHVHHAAGVRMLDAIAEADPVDALQAVIEESLPLDKPRRAEWRVWLAFWGRAATDPRLAREQRVRYREWTGLLSDLIEMTGLTVGVDTLVAIVDGVGTRATLDPKAFPARRQLALVDGVLD